MRDRVALWSRGYRPLWPMLVVALVLTTALTLLTVLPRTSAQLWVCSSAPGCRWLGVETLSARDFVSQARGAVVALMWPVAILISAIAWLRYRHVRLVSRPLLFLLPLMTVQFMLSGWGRAPAAGPGIESFSTGITLLIQATVVSATVAAFGAVVSPARAERLAFRTSFAQTALLALGAGFVAMVTGTAVSLSGSTAAGCAAWPFCGGWSLPTTWSAWVHGVHRASVGLGAVLMLFVLLRAWREHRAHTGVLLTATLAGVLFFAQSGVGAVQAVRGGTAGLHGLHAATSAGLWAALVALVVQAGALDSDGRLRPAAPGNHAVVERLRDFIALSKPIIVALLLFTTLGGMVVAAEGLPDLRLVLWTLVGGALAAGGSGAVNQYIDRRLDRMMTRTKKRPIAAGRLTPAEGLAFGVGLCVMAFYLLVVFVNAIAAVLSVAGMVYYVVLYSLLLKNTTVQNIVIGGGAGAIPPLVGWAAVTGSLSVPALTLFLVIFFWTPPHFWALALVRRKDYQRAGVPMLPVVHGEADTRRQILLYTIGLVALTLVLPALGVGGAVYLALAGLLGAWLIRAAWKVWREEGNKVAWRMYRHSSMYLAFLFLALMLDAAL